MGVSGGPDIVEDGLVLYLDAGNRRSYSGTGTTWADLSGKGNNGTLVDSPTFLTGNLGFFSFDGINDQATILNNVNFDFGTGDFCIQAWIRITSLATYHSILEARTSAAYSNYVFGVYNIGGILRLDFVNAGGSSGRSATTTSIPLNTWTHVVWTRTSGITSYYVNTVKDATTNNYAGSLTPTNPNIYIGSVVDPYFFNGNIGIISVYKKSFTQQEVSQNFNAIRGRYGI